MPPTSTPFRLLALIGALLSGGCVETSKPPPAAASPAVGAGDAVQPARRAAPRSLPPVAPRNAYVLLSGGGTPLSNNYSQYVQARGVAEFLQRECAGEPTWIFFGIGNREGAPPVLADVRRETTRDGFVVQSWLAGPLPDNRPATKENFLKTLRDEILPTVRGGGTLFLFVGDHGEVAGRDDQRESAITMWQLKRSDSWDTDKKGVLGVAELRRTLAAGLGQGRVVFCMTQCHSGGFHELGVAREPVPPTSWFAALPPSFATARTSFPLIRAAGYTATDLESPAAGCVADPDPEGWSGYERYLPERLFGRDLLSGRAAGPAAPSFALAHEAATLIDRTIDKPRATSEHFLETWAKLIETRLIANAPLLTPQVEQAVAAFRQGVDTGRVTVDDPALRARQAQFDRFTFQLAADVPAAKDLLVSGKRQELEAALRSRGERGAGRGGRRGGMTELRRSWTETLRPAWKAAVLAGRVGVGQLTGATLEFEKQLLKLEDDGRDFLLPRGADETTLSNELYWRSGYSDPTTLDATKAQAMARWAAERRARIIAWGRASTDAAVRAAAEKIGPGATSEPEVVRPMGRRTAIERVLFYRRVLAAWEFLIRVGAEPQLAQLHALIEVERAPIRPGS